MSAPIDPENHPEELPLHARFWDPTITLIIVVGGKVLRSHKVGGKKELLALAPNAEHVMAAWHGERWTNVFVVSRERWEAEAASRQRK